MTWWWWCYLLACRFARALVFSLLMAALSYFPPKNVHLFKAKRSALSLVCVQSSIQKLQEYYFAVLIYKFLIYVKDKGEESFYYNIKICWI